MDVIKFDKEEFLNSELGQDLCDCIKEWIFALVDLDRCETGSPKRKRIQYTLNWEYAQWLVYKKMLKDIFGVEYHFRDKEECAGLCTKDGTDWLVKFYKTGV